MGTKLTIPEWVGSTLTNGAFLDYADRSLAAYVAVGLDQISMTDIGMKLTEAVDDLRLAVNRQKRRSTRRRTWWWRTATATSSPTPFGISGTASRGYRPPTRSRRT